MRLFEDVGCQLLSLGRVHNFVFELFFCKWFGITLIIAIVKLVYREI